MTTLTRAAPPRTINLFLSWAHHDQRLKDDLVARLTWQLKMLSEVSVNWWEDSHLLCGEAVGPAIADAIRSADFGVCLLSPAYFGSDFITRHELPYFVGPHSQKGALPVALGVLPAFDSTRSFHGVEETWVYFYAGKPFSSLRGRRDLFAQGLTEQIRRRALGLGSWRQL